MNHNRIISHVNWMVHVTQSLFEKYNLTYGSFYLFLIFNAERPSTRICSAMDYYTFDLLTYESSSVRNMDFPNLSFQYFLNSSTDLNDFSLVWKSILNLFSTGRIQICIDNLVEVVRETDSEFFDVLSIGIKSDFINIP